MSCIPFQPEMASFMVNDIFRCVYISFGMPADVNHCPSFYLKFLVQFVKHKRRCS